VLPPQILHTLEIDKGLLAHTRRGTGPPKNRENLKFVLKFSVLDSITSGIVDVFSLNFFMRPAITARGISSSWNWFCTRTCGAGRPQVWLCHARLVCLWTNVHHVSCKSFGKDIPTSMEVIEAQTLNFKANFKFSRWEFFGGHPSQLGSDLGSLWSISNAL